MSNRGLALHLINAEISGKKLVREALGHYGVMTTKVDKEINKLESYRSKIELNNKGIIYAYLNRII